jgi:hypothetical protein
VILAGTDQLVDAVEVGTDETVGEQAAIHVGENDGSSAARCRCCVGRANNVGGCTLERLQVQVVSAAGEEMDLEDYKILIFLLINGSHFDHSGFARTDGCQTFHFEASSKRLEQREKF